MAQNQPQSSSTAKLANSQLYVKYGLVVLGYVALYFAVMFFLGADDVRDLVDPTNVLSLSVFLFLAGSSLKVNFGSLLFLLNLVAGVVLVSFLTFTQGLLILLVMLLVQKLLKVL